jgi:anti-sigma factor RsiW
MNDCDLQLLSSYHDGELAVEQRQRVERHVTECARCAAELQALRETSAMFAHHQFQDLTEPELKRAHEAIDETATEQPVWRLAATLGAIAASVLIVSCAWLTALPPASSSAGASAPTFVAQRPVQRAEPWEQMAMTLRPEPLGSARDDTTRLADARLADWMLQGLSGKTSTDR